MKNYVIDASVVLSMVLKEDQKTVEMIRNLIKEVERGKANLWTTVFFRHEIANGLCYSDKKRDEIFLIWEKFRKLPIIPLELEKNFLASIVILSRKLGTTVHDTAYHYQAMVIDGTFLTRDKKYYRKAKKLGNIECF